jgi:hypothetical protein
MFARCAPSLSIALEWDTLFYTTRTGSLVRKIDVVLLYVTTESVAKNGMCWLYLITTIFVYVVALQDQEDSSHVSDLEDDFHERDFERRLFPLRAVQ